MGSSWQIFTSGRAGGAEPEEPQAFTPPPWQGPAEEELGRAVDIATVLGRSDRGIVALTYAVAHSNGLQLNLLARASGLKRREAASLFHEQHSAAEPDEELPPGFLRLGLELPDGTRVSNLDDPRRRGRWDEEPQGPYLVMSGGGGGSAMPGTVDLRPGYWLWPLVGEGTLRVSVEWPIVDVPFTTTELDATPLREAGLRAVKL